MDWILENWPVICASVIGAIAIVDRIVAWSPTKRDDLVWTPMKKILNSIFQGGKPTK